MHANVLTFERVCDMANSNICQCADLGRVAAIDVFLFTGSLQLLEILEILEI